MHKWDAVAIVGVGLMGGSIGLALQQRGLARSVIGIGRSQASLDRARQCGAVTGAVTDIQRGVADAQLVIVCTPVRQVVSHVQQAAQYCAAGTLLTDVGSTKAQIAAALDGRQGWPAGVAFVGSHPLAGSEKGGVEYARGDLFQDRVVVVTPTKTARDEDVERLSQFWEGLGGRVLRTSPEQHDQVLARTSHLPHLVASALAASLSQDELRFIGTGWLDSTRIAAGDPGLWQQILLDNRSHILQALDKFEKVLSNLRGALDREDEAELVKLLEAGKRNRDALGN